MPQPFSPDAAPEGDYAVVELLGHRTIAGRVSEVERFGAKFLSVEPIYQNWLLDPVLIGGGSIYQFTSCSALAAYTRRAKYEYDLQGGLAAITADLSSPPFDASFALAQSTPRFLDDEDLA